jgi:hypothetical protein
MRFIACKLYFDVDVGWERSEPIVQQKTPTSNVSAGDTHIMFEQEEPYKRFRLTRLIYIILKAYAMHMRYHLSIKKNIICVER